MGNVGKCRLCNKEKKLIRAHIIPDFMYKKMRDENNVFYEVAYNLDDKSNKVKKIQTGDFDSNILCGDCDNKILGGIYEKYANVSMYGKDLDTNIAPECTNYNNDGAEFTICKNVDYSKYKLFLLSILWRASISNRPTFKDVSLGIKHEENIRNMLYNNISPEEYEYPIIISSFIKSDNTFENLITQPRRVRTKGGLNGYLFLIDGLQFNFYVNSVSHKLPDFIDKVNFKKNGELTILHLPKGSDMQFMKNIITK